MPSGFYELALRLDQTKCISFSLVYDIDLVCLCIAEYEEIVSGQFHLHTCILRIHWLHTKLASKKMNVANTLVSGAKNFSSLESFSSTAAFNPSVSSIFLPVIVILMMPNPFAVYLIQEVSWFHYIISTKKSNEFYKILCIFYIFIANIHP